MMCKTCKQDCSTDQCECQNCDCEGCQQYDCAEEDDVEHKDAKMTLGVARIDQGELKAAQLLPNGYLKCEARLTRTGVFIYRNDDGSERRELRLDEEVFKPDSLETFAMAPITDEHPPVFLNSKNTSEFQRGHMGETIRKDGKFAVGSLLVTDNRLVSKMQKGKAVQVSCGYTCDLEERSGVTKSGEKYDAIQRNIRGNHVAIVPLGRAGPEARVRMDTGADVLVSIAQADEDSPRSQHSPERSTVNKIKIDGVEYEAGSPQAIAAQANYQAKLDARAKEINDAEKARADAETKAKNEKDALQAKLDAAEEDRKKLAADLRAAPEKIATALKARMALESSARGVLGNKAKFDGLSDKEIMLAVLKKTNPDLKVDNKTDAYIEARFDAALESSADEDEGDDERADGVSAARGVVMDTDDGEADPGDPAEEMSDEEANKPHKDSVTAREAMVHRHRNAWKQPIGGERAE
jgi:hypothetical protein